MARRVKPAGFLTHGLKEKIKVIMQRSDRRKILKL